MPVLVRRQTTRAALDTVTRVLTDVARIPERTEVPAIREASGSQVVTGATWKNRGATLKLPSWDSSRVTEVTPQRIAWHTRSMVLGLILVGADWSYTLKPVDAGTEITHTFERVTMFGLPVGLLIKAPFLPMVYLARGAMMAGEKKLDRVLSEGASTRP